jgi:hypothetical protein
MMDEENWKQYSLNDLFCNQYTPDQMIRYLHLLNFHFQLCCHRRIDHWERDLPFFHFQSHHTIWDSAKIEQFHNVYNHIVVSYFIQTLTQLTWCFRCSWNYTCSSGRYIITWTIWSSPSRVELRSSTIASIRCVCTCIIVIIQKEWDVLR